MASEFLRNFIASLTTTKSLNDRKCFNPAQTESFYCKMCWNFREFTISGHVASLTDNDLDTKLQLTSAWQWRLSVCVPLCLSLCVRVSVSLFVVITHVITRILRHTRTDRQTDGRTGGSESARGGKAAPGRAVQSCAVRVSKT